MLILIRFAGELVIKAKQTRSRFAAKLARNIEDALRSNGVEFKLQREWGRFLLEADDPQTLLILKRIFGIHSFSVVESRKADTLEEVVREGEQFFKDRVQGKRFAVRARRGGDKQKIPFRSAEVERELGTALLPHAAGVNLDEPEVTAHVEVKQGTAYFHTGHQEGPGGLPVGTEGRALALVSGGFDSAVAAWRMLKRGVEVDYLFCNLGGEAHRRDVLRVSKILSDQWSYGYRPQLFAVDFEPVVRNIRDHGVPRYWQILLKRLMVRAGHLLADREEYLALVTGEAVGQVSSQTLQNLLVITHGARLPILRPLLCMDKSEIIGEARTIGTYEMSAGVEEYCAIVPKKPATAAGLDTVLEQESKLDLPLLDRAVARADRYDLRSLDPAGLAEAEIELESIPDDAVVIDLRPEELYELWHPPGAVRKDFYRIMDRFKELDPSPTYVFYCELGLRSAHLAEVMRNAGYKAHHIKGGAKTLLKQKQVTH